MIAAPRLLAVVALATLLTMPVVLACSSSDGAGSTTTKAAAGSSGATSETTGTNTPAPQAGSPGPGGVGNVVVTSDGAGTYVDITPDELAAMLKNKDFLFINAHIPYAGEIEQTDLFLPYDQAAQQLDQLPADRNAKIVVYCRSDRMSRISIEEWVRAGYTDLYNLDGGFEAWAAAGFDLLQK